MKATKFFLMIALVSFALMSFAGNDVDRTNHKVKISLIEASHNPGLSQAIYQQVDQSILGGERSGVIVARVSYKKTTFMVYGSYNQWRRFFTVDKPSGEKPLIDL